MWNEPLFVGKLLPNLDELVLPALLVPEQVDSGALEHQGTDFVVRFAQSAIVRGQIVGRLAQSADVRLQALRVLPGDVGRCCCGGATESRIRNWKKWGNTRKNQENVEKPKKTEITKKFGTWKFLVYSNSKLEIEFKFEIETMDSENKFFPKFHRPWKCSIIM